MSFLYVLTPKKHPHKRKKYKSRKELKDSPIIYKEERASVFTSKGSLTLEAAIAVPMFLFAILCLAYLLEIMAIRTGVRNALYGAGKELAQQTYQERFLTADELEQKIKEQVKHQGVDPDNLDCKGTNCHWNTGILDLKVRYPVEIPIPMFWIPPVFCEESLRVKGWNGYVATIGSGTSDQIVYVTDTGIVYHEDPDCTYLDLSIHAVSADELEEIRNLSGGKYYACEACGKRETDEELRYITDYGTRYHTTLTCKKIKRTIYAISLDEAYGLGGCSKCVK